MLHFNDMVSIQFKTSSENLDCLQNTSPEIVKFYFIVLYQTNNWIEQKHLFIIDSIVFVVFTVSVLIKYSGL